MRTATALLVLAMACASSKPAKSDPAPHVEISRPRELCSDRNMLSADSFCLNVPRIERLMARDDFRVLERGEPGRHTSDVHIVTIEVPDGSEQMRFRVKWKACAENGEGWNNQPRKELAAYELQKLFLEPKDYVVPPTMLRCLPLERVKSQLAAVDPKPTFPGTNCVLGIMSYWLENVTNQSVFNPHRFQIDHEYREAISNLNLFTYVIDHRDVHDGNFLVSADSKRPRAFSVDHGFAFSGLRNPMPWVRDQPIWSEIIVPALPREKVEGFRSITRRQLDALGTVAQFEIEEGMLEPDELEPPLDPNEGVRVKGDVVQFGLEKDEIDGIEDRIEKLLAKVEDHEIALFE